MSVDVADAAELIGACAAPSEAFWRILELDAVRGASHLFREPILELGCGDGTFTRLAGLRVAVGTDRDRRAVARAAANGPYERVLQLDLHDLDPQRTGRFGTVFANSVLEHVPALESALPRVAGTLLPGGRLIATVPLAEMSRHLAARGDRYAAWRQRQLQHRNLWAPAVWTEKLRAAGFATIEWREYLPGGACRFWDRADVAGTLGRGRYRLAPAAHRAVTWLIPDRLSEPAKRRLAELLLSRAGALTNGPPCAALLCASTPP